jgi:cysteinyl-tRNA synthetase
MKIYNTLTRKKEEFKPIEEGKVKIYVCGPTVYNFIHIGNARPMIVFDTLRRYLIYKGYEVNYVSNFTDVDDKIIKESIEEGISAEEVSTKYIAECKKDMTSLNVMPATTHPQATQEIPEMLEMISTLIDKGYAYKADDGTVYYSTRKFKGYGKLSHKNIDDLQQGHREIKVNGVETKEDALDFVLWKPKKEGEPFWESPWCEGRPGWHIECSCMAKKYLGETIDIHAGGEDLIFPHHENEIAQSEAANGKPFANYWMHNAFINIDGQKMSKSLGNFFTVRDILKEYEGRVIRFFMLQVSYRSPLNFSREIMESSKSSLQRIITAGSFLSDLMDKKNDSLDAGNGSDGVEDTSEVGGSDKALIDELPKFRTQFNEAMDDDLNTADALTAIFDLVKFINSNINENSSKELIKAASDELTELTSVLGLDISEEKGLLDDDIQALIEERNAARKAKNFARADEIRDSLKAQGIILEDTKDGVKWHRA